MGDPPDTPNDVANGNEDFKSSLNKCIKPEDIKNICSSKTSFTKNQVLMILSKFETILQQDQPTTTYAEETKKNCYTAPVPEHFTDTLRSINSSSNKTTIKISKSPAEISKSLIQSKTNESCTQLIANSLIINRKYKNSCLIKTSAATLPSITKTLESANISHNTNKKLNPTISLKFIPDWISNEEVLSVCTKNICTDSKILFSTPPRNNFKMINISINPASLHKLPHHIYINIMKIQVNLEINPQKCKTCKLFGHSTKNHSKFIEKDSPTPTDTSKHDSFNYCSAIKKTINNTDLSFMKSDQFYTFLDALTMKIFKTKHNDVKYMDKTINIIFKNQHNLLPSND